MPETNSSNALGYLNENPIYNVRRDLPDAPKAHKRLNGTVSLADALAAL